MSGFINVNYQIAPNAAQRAEGQFGTTPFSFTVQRSGPTLASPQELNWRVETGWDFVDGRVRFFGTASGDDFAGPTAGTITFSAGVFSQPIIVNVAGDLVREPDESFTVLVNFGRGPEIGSGTMGATGTIVADEPTIRVDRTQDSRAEGEFGATRFTYTASRTGSLDSWDWVDWFVVGSGVTPANAADFAGGVLPWGRAAFAPGERTKTFAVEVAGDTLREGDETFTLQLLNPSPGAELATTQVVDTIRADEPVISLQSEFIQVAEGQWGVRNAEFTVQRAGALDTWSHIDWFVSTADGNAADGADFANGVMPWGRAVFAPGQDRATISIGIAGDVQREDDERFQLNLVNPSDGAALSPARTTAIGEIKADEPTIRVVGSWNWRDEGDSGATPLLFTAIRDTGLDSWDWVDWYVTGSGNRPADGADFAGGVAPWGRAVFAPGQQWASIEVWVNGDMAFEGDEEFTLNLVNPSPGAALETAAVTGRILADEPAISLVASNTWRAEGNAGSTPFIFTAIRDGNLSDWAYADWLAVGAGPNPANAGDFVGGVGAWGRAVFAPGEKWATITVDVVGDTVSEPTEDFAVTLMRASPGVTITTASAGGRILSDDVL
jgi:hypothetical protein